MQTLMSLLLSYFSEGFKTMYLTTHDKQDFYQHVGYCFCKPVVSCGAQSSNLPKHFVSIIFQVHYSMLNSNICRFHLAIFVDFIGRITPKLCDFCFLILLQLEIFHFVYWLKYNVQFVHFSLFFSFFLFIIFVSKNFNEFSVHLFHHPIKNMNVNLRTIWLKSVAIICYAHSFFIGWSWIHLDMSSNQVLWDVMGSVHLYMRCQGENSIL